MTKALILVTMLLLVSFTPPGRVVRQQQFAISEITLRDTFLLEQVR